MATMKLGWNWSLQGLEWIARISSLVSICLLFMFLIGDFQPSRVRPMEWVGILFFPVGVMVGMILAWWKEGTGAVVTVGSFAAFYLIYGFLLRNHAGGWAFLAFAGPGFLFLLHWLLVHGGKKPILR